MDHSNESAVSPVIGVVLLVAVSIVLSALVFTAVNGTIGTLDADSAMSTDSGVAGSQMTIQSDKVSFQSMTGSGMPVADVKFVVQVGSESVTITDINYDDGSFTATGNQSLLNGTRVGGSAVGAGADAGFSPGESIEIPLNKTHTADNHVRVSAVDVAADRLIRTSEREKPRASGESVLLTDGTQNATVTIDNPTGQTLTDYQVQVTVDHQPDMSDDFSDIRFVQNGQNLDYWITSKTDGSQATVWVEVAEIPDGGTDITLNYGDASRTSESDARATMVRYDLWNGNGVTGTLEGDARLINEGASNEYLELTDAVDNQQGILNYGTTPSPGFHATFEWYIGDGTGADSLSIYAWSDGTRRYHEDPNGHGIHWHLNDHDSCMGLSYDTGTPQCGDIENTSASPEQSAWKSATWWGVRNSDGSLDYHHSALGKTLEGTWSSATYPGDQFGFGGRTGGKNNHHWIRNVVIRKYVGQELSTSVTY